MPKELCAEKKNPHKIFLTQASHVRGRGLRGATSQTKSFAIGQLEYETLASRKF